jgi:hypothetical protein
MPNVVDNEQIYNVIKLGGKTSPGKVTLSGHNRKVNWNVNAGYALVGATVTFKNVPPIEFTASFYLVKDFAQGIDDYAAWDDFKKVIDSTLAGSKVHALAIYHPDLIENDIKTVCKAEIGGRVYDGRGGCTVAVKFQEYRAPKKLSGAVAEKPQDDPNAALKAEVATLTAKYQQTPWQ